MSDQRGTWERARRAVAALAVLTLSACGAQGFSMGGGTTTTTSTGGGPSSAPAGYTSPTGLVPGDSTALPIDPSSPVTSGTDRANASTPNIAGRARTYPTGDYDGFGLIDSYGHPEAQRGDGYYVSIRERWLIIAGDTVAEATRRAKATGFVGRISVTPEDNYNPHCPEGTVCRVYPANWQSNPDGDLMLYVNRSVKISSPD